MIVICYVCNKSASVFTQNLTKYKSQHSKTPISDFIRKFLGDFESSRNIDDESNCICSKCLIQVIEYDLTTQKAIEQEKALRELLISTEMDLNLNSSSEVEILECEDNFSNESISGDEADEKNEANPTGNNEKPCIESVNCDLLEDELVDRQSEPTSPLESTSTVTDKQSSTNPNLKTPQTIMIRRNGRLQRVRVIQKTMNLEPKSRKILNNLPHGAMFRGKNGRIFQKILKKKPTEEKSSSIVEKLRQNIHAKLIRKRNFRPKKCDLCDSGQMFTRKREYEVRI